MVPQPVRSSRIAPWSVRAATVVAGVLVAAFAIFLTTYLTGGWAAIDDVWVGAVVGGALLGGLFVSLVAFIGALTVVMRHERWPALWLPLLLFPTILAFLAVGELFWWE
jgi:hypothetical protein